MLLGLVMNSYLSLYTSPDTTRLGVTCVKLVLIATSSLQFLAGNKQLDFSHNFA